MQRLLPYLLLPLLVVGAGIGSYFLFRTQPTQHTPPTNPTVLEDPTPKQPDPLPDANSGGNAKLVVLVVVDQLCADHLTRWAELFGTDGFVRMQKEGIWFSDCHIPYACTSTGPGHASLVTGAAPAVHGIVENAWYDRKSGEPIYCCQPTRPYDLIPPVPAALGKPGRGAATGYSPERLLSPTVGDALIEATMKKGRVFSLSLKDRPAILMGGRGPNGAYCFDLRDGKFRTSAFYGRDAEHAWVAEFNKGKPADAWFHKKWEKLRPELDYEKFSGPDDVEAEGKGYNGQGRVFPHDYTGELLEPAAPYYGAVEASPAGNELLFALMKRCVMAERLGRGSACDLLCISFSSNDIIGHIWGPDSQETLDVTLRTDLLIAEMLKFLDAEVGKDRYTLLLTADHGVCPMPELESTKKQYPAAKRLPLIDLGIGLLEALDEIYGKHEGVSTPWIEAYDEAMGQWIYLNHKAIEARKLKVEDVADVARDWLAGRAFTETAFTRKELADRDAPDRPFLKAAMLAYNPERAGDVLVIPKPGVLITQYKNGSGHGSPHAYDTHIPLLLFGADVAALGERKEKVSSLTVAPILSWALGIPAPRDAALPLPEAIPVKK